MSSFSAGHGEKKTRKLDQFLAAVLSHKSIEAAAKSVGIAASTGRRWLQQPAVIQRLREARRDAWSRALAQLQEAGPEAVEALRRTLREAEGESVIVSAAKSILELGLRVVELGDIEERINRLEHLAKSRWKGTDHDREDQTATRPAGGLNGPA
jgi:hypothetical protein